MWHTHGPRTTSQDQHLDIYSIIIFYKYFFWLLEVSGVFDFWPGSQLPATPTFRKVRSWKKKETFWWRTESIGRPLRSTARAWSTTPPRSPPTPTGESAHPSRPEPSWFGLTAGVCRALCYLSVKQYRDAVRDCDKALMIDGCNIKALYRRAQAHREMKVRIFITSAPMTSCCWSRSSTNSSSSFPSRRWKPALKTWTSCSQESPRTRPPWSCSRKCRRGSDEGQRFGFNRCCFRKAPEHVCS